jgi:hypothetical protein
MPSAPREVWAFEATEPADKIAIVAVRITTSLRIDYLLKVIDPRKLDVGSELSNWRGPATRAVT